MTRAIRLVSGSKKRLTLAGVIVVAAVAALGAIAYWTTTGAGSGAASAGTLNAPTNQTASVSGANVTVAWDAALLSNSTPADSYTVERYDGSGGDIGPACGGATIPSSSGTPNASGHFTCTDTPGSGTVEYKIAAKYHSWTATSGFTNTVTVASDATAPTSAITFPTASYYNNAGWTFGVLGCAASICGTAADEVGGSGLAHVDVSVLGPGGNYWNGTDFTSSSEVKFAATGTTSWTLAFSASNFATAGGGDGSYTVTSYARDNASNVQSPGTSVTFHIDNTAPTNSLSLTTQSPATSSFKSGSTIYYRGTGGGSGGSFKIRNAVADSGSGPASSATAALGGTTTGWTHTPSTVSTPPGGPYDSNTFTWAEGTSSSPTEVVTGADVAGNTTAAPTLTFTNDSTNPTGGVLTVNGQSASGGGTTGYNNSGSFSISAITDYTDAGSGLASSTLVRDQATLSSSDGIVDGTCGSFGSPTTITSRSTRSRSR